MDGLKRLWLVPCLLAGWLGGCAEPRTSASTPAAAARTPGNYLQRGTVDTLTGGEGFQDGSFGDARFEQPKGVTVGPDGTIYVADTGNHRIRVIRQGQVFTLAGGARGYADGSGAEASFDQPTSLVLDGSGQLIVADAGNRRLRVITMEGVVTTLAGGDGPWTDGDLATARFSMPYGLALDPQGNLYVSEPRIHALRVVTATGIYTLAHGSGGFADGTLKTARFNFPLGLAIDPQGNLLVADSYNQRIRLVTPQGLVRTVAGTGATVVLNQPQGVAVDPAGQLYVADSYNHRVRKQVIASLSTLAGGGMGLWDGLGAAAAFNRPGAVAVAPDGSLVVADTANHGIRLIR